MLVLAGEVHDLCHFGLGDLIGVNATFANSVIVNMHHDPRRGVAVLVEEPLENIDDEFHRRVVIIEQEHAIHIGPLRLRPRLGDNGTARRPRQSGFAATLTIAVAEPGPRLADRWCHRPSLRHRSRGYRLATSITREACRKAPGSEIPN